MTSTFRTAGLDRRALLAGLASFGAAAVAGPVGAQPRQSLAKWRDKIGLQLYTVRDRFPTDYAGTMKAVSAIGFKEVQSTLNYAGLSFDQIKKALDDAHLISAVTHVNPPPGPQFEPTLDAYARIGHRYTTVAVSAPISRQTPSTSEQVKKVAAELNAAGAITKKHGLKVIFHNHTEEFEPLTDKPNQVPYDIIMSETDPDLVALEIDAGWATAGGANVLDLFKRAPGRYEVWHVKDFKDLASLQSVRPLNRLAAGSSKIVGLGQGEIDYRPIFAAADQAGLKHFYIEQDTAPATGDSLAAAGASYRYLAQLLT
ncbi:MAG: hypothetical protein BGN86_01580 [Caulobacterales bacterium 68-7]|nr:MAG: hypothetical protein BGN86_01580 [Caulobacterales bacterium 68-7]